MFYNMQNSKLLYHRLNSPMVVFDSKTVAYQNYELKVAGILDIGPYYMLVDFTRGSDESLNGNQSRLVVPKVKQ